MKDVTVIEDPAAVSPGPLRARLPAGLTAGPGAAAEPARVGPPRRKVSHHLQALERHGPVGPAGERRKGGVAERPPRAAASYVIPPLALAGARPAPERARDRLSACRLPALAARLPRDAGSPLAGAGRAGPPLAIRAPAGEVRFASAAGLAAFPEELTAGVGALIRTCHDGTAAAGHGHRVVIAPHPAHRTDGPGAPGAGTARTALDMPGGAP